MPPNHEQATGNSEQSLGEVIVDGHPWPVVINRLAQRFEARVGEHVAFIAFRVHGSALSLIHTEAPVALRGKGLADSLARTALNYARDRGMTVKPFCPFVAAYIRRHREYEDVIDPKFSPAIDPAGNGTERDPTGGS
jgi:predicted GNAT family acetyltransferase